MKRLLLLFILALALIGCGSQTASPNQAATATNNAAVAAGETAISNGQLTQAAMPPSPTPTATPFPTPQTGTGGTQSSGPWTITVNSIMPTVSTNQFEVPKPGKQFILVNFTAQNTSASPQDMNPFYFTLRGDSGTSYDLAALTVASDPSGTVLPAQKLRGDLAYEVPLSLHGFTLQFDTPEDVDHTQIIQWQLTL